MPDNAPRFADLMILRRWPRRQNERLRAWDAADHYLVNTLGEQAAGPATLVLNDQYGALWLSALALGPAWSAGDSWLAWRAVAANAEDNGLNLPRAHWLWPWQQPAAPVDQVVMRVPKEISLLEAQLAWLASFLPAGTPVWLAGMDKHLPPQLVPLMKRYLGNGRAGLGWKKARRFQAQAPGQPLAEAPPPAAVMVPERGWSLISGPGVFGRRHLDIGARFLLDHLPGAVDGKVADLGCGNGVLGLALAADNPAARITFCDESALAIDSARANAAKLGGDPNRYQFHLGHGLDGLEPTFDLILLNPPFHRGHAVDEQVARTLFRHAAQGLTAEGELRVVANRHLAYQRPLGKLFRRVETLASNAKFVIHRCRQPRR